MNYHRYYLYDYNEWHESETRLKFNELHGYSHVTTYKHVMYDRKAL